MHILQDKTPADGLSGGIAEVKGRPAVIQALDPLVMASTEGEVHLRKSEFCHSYAKKRNLPLFNLCEGGGLRMPDGVGSDGISDKLFPDCLLDHGRTAPVLTAILGDSTWMAVTSDFVNQKQGTGMAVAGPRMLEMASGEKLSGDELGGTAVHVAHTGQIDHIGQNEKETIEALQDFFEYLPSNEKDTPPFKESREGGVVEKPELEDCSFQ
ncbi:carboxyl transferase domain-containing protein [Alteribacillus sp. JSM 102045]|uniref:carboxyl transferase domain-containing protein n=1 Tax=Alteribacillus sp. JSM 102045 TaxID=1562101 RepID=UPI0035BF5EF4